MIARWSLKNDVPLSSVYAMMNRKFAEGDGQVLPVIPHIDDGRKVSGSDKVTARDGSSKVSMPVCHRILPRREKLE